MRPCLQVDTSLDSSIHTWRPSAWWQPASCFQKAWCCPRCIEQVAVAKAPRISIPLHWLSALGKTTGPFILFPDHQRSQSGELVGPTWVISAPGLQMPMQSLALLLHAIARKSWQNMEQQVPSKVSSHAQVHAVQPVYHKSPQKPHEGQRKVVK